MENGKFVKCPENETLAAHLLNKRKEIAGSAKGISDNLDLTFSKAYSNVCNCKTPIRTLRELSQIKGVGKWMLKQMQTFFETDSCQSDDNDLTTENGNKKKAPKRYVPQKNSVAYALLITLFRETESGSEFMRKHDLIDAAETSGLARVPIAPEKAKGKAGHFGSSSKDWYTGWSCMKTLINKGLVVKSSCPAKYMLSNEGKDVARDCLSRSGMADLSKGLDGSSSNLDQIDKVAGFSSSDTRDKSKFGSPGDLLNLEYVGSQVAKATRPSKRQKKSIDVPTEHLNKFMSMGFPKEQIIHIFSEVTKTYPEKDISSLWPTVLCRLREEEVYGSTSVPKSPQKVQHFKPASYQIGNEICSSANIQPCPTAGSSSQNSSLNVDSGEISWLKVCSSRDPTSTKIDVLGSDSKNKSLPIPPLTPGEKFADVYEVILVLDQREHFAKKGSRSMNIINGICSQFKILIEVRRLPVGDAIWVARHKYFGSEYVLDFIVERKKVDDLRCSIRDNRYKDQKMRLARCGLKKMIYLVEGDPNSSEAAESIKTACFTTEILEGFDVQRTMGLADTLKKYGFLTQAIEQYYRSLDRDRKCPGVCSPFKEFIRRCEELDKMTVTDVFAVQLMQVPHVTEDVALAVLDLYPTILSLARAYSRLDGDVVGQEGMLQRQSNNAINGPASKNIFQLVWGS